MCQCFESQEWGGQHAAFAPPILILTPIGLQVVVDELMGTDVGHIVWHARWVRISIFVVNYPPQSIPHTSLTLRINCWY